MIKETISFIIGVCISMFGWLSNLFKAPVPVETAQQAQIIGERVAHESFPNINYNNYSIRVHDKCHSTRDTWCISYYLIDSNGEPAPVFGGGGPEIHIRKRDGKILRVTLQR